MSEGVYFDYNPWWEGAYRLENIVDRPLILDKLEKHFPSPSIVLITGLRRIGKTTLLKLLIKRLIDKGVEPKRIFYVSLDDYLLSSKSIIEIVDDFRKVQRLKKEDKIILFFDEIAHKDRFHQQLKNLYDKYNLKIYATSSSSSVLRDQRSMLTGREQVIEVLPLDFFEYLEFKNITIKKRDKPLLEGHFEDFLQTGGIPEYVLTGDRGYIQTLVDDIIYKDIIAFHNLKNHQLVKDLFQILIHHTCGPLSIYKISKVLKISTETAKRYLGYFIDTFLIYLIPRYGKTNVMLSSPKKIYAPDIGIRNVFTGTLMKGKQFENYIYLKIKHLNPAYVFEDETEIDFIINKNILAEIKYQGDLNPKQKILFDRFKIEEKMVIKDLDDSLKLEKHLKQLQSGTRP